ncbi:MAG: PepSY domain-containing protein [Cyanobacteria bacterium]|nr:PepSY domain-containing protein [Cyanobacteria bacterium CG_2015-16_32_12]NCO79395.1 PepSY domain-containing protein [Cyanobacteria bacterium CG_2015-22_32_23]NCQ04643.1 PepSY domain-containing protein [Cyanobacteria bacterium CG_2015-09_32_10]NCS85715.1 PepSY domain-containing protein [Cyanobacteria bacterium CG_2015-02_32_10]
MKNTIVYLILLSSVVVSPSVFADDMPPPNAKPLSEIVRNLETKGFSPIVEIDFDDSDGWEIKAYRNNQKRELKVNPLSGEIISDTKDD